MGAAVARSVASRAVKPIPTNTRRAAKELFDKKPEEKPWFGIEQESRGRPQSP